MTTTDLDVSALARMLAAQEELQRRLYGAAPKDFTPQDRETYVKDMTLALGDELHEALREISWKPWASAVYFRRDAFVGELVDGWHFFMNLLLAAGVTADEFVARYEEKLVKNHRRQDEGYDGVSSKCPGCRRDVTDVGVECEQVGDRWWCVVEQRHVTWVTTP